MVTVTNFHKCSLGMVIAQAGWVFLRQANPTPASFVDALGWTFYRSGSSKHFLFFGVAHPLEARSK